MAAPDCKRLKPCSLVTSCRKEQILTSEDELFVNFNEALETWIFRPQVIHKRVVGTKEWFRIKTVELNFPIDDLSQRVVVDSGRWKLAEVAFKSLLNHFKSVTLLDLFNHFDKSVKIENEDLHSDSSVILVEFISKKEDCNCYQLILKTTHEASFLCFSFLDNQLWFLFYQLTLTTNEAKYWLELSSIQDQDYVPYSGLTRTWLETTLFDKILLWINSSQKSGFGVSLRLINLELYAENYRKLKGTYGIDLVKSWPEVTDPQKFVYEDVAIASYLITLWTNFESSSKPKFLDLGCGNGLLVHILSQEGFPGYGIDLRKRRIWDEYPASTDLREQSIVPSDSELFPDVDWIIGNHSDELTPWIPFIAGRSSVKTNFFLLPCCFWDFDKKFVRKTSSNNQYRSYLDYVKEVGTVAGFNVDEDVMRIPSTKRICFVGKRKTDLDEAVLESQRLAFIKSRTLNLPNQAENNWATNFKPREKVEKVRNCSKIDKDLKAMVVSTVAKELLKYENKECLPWNPGRKMEMKEIVGLFESSTLKELKSECGGLKTLLKNHNQVFKIIGNIVQFRDPRVEKSVKPEKFKKTSLCWFDVNHPDGCPLPINDCNFAHGLLDKKEAVK